MTSNRGLGFPPGEQQPDRGLGSQSGNAAATASQAGSMCHVTRPPRGSSSSPALSIVVFAILALYVFSRPASAPHVISVDDPDAALEEPQPIHTGAVPPLPLPSLLDSPDEESAQPIATVGSSILTRTVDNAGTPASPWTPDTPLRDWEFIVLHHSATEAGTVAGIDATHRQRRDSQGNPWRGIGYHFVVGNGHGMADGHIEPCFRWKEQSAGAHAGVKQYNEQGIGICLIGDFQSSPPTDAQLHRVAELVTYLKRTCKIPADHVVGHGNFRSTECPGRFFPLTEIAQSPFVEPKARQTIRQASAEK